MLLLSGVVLKCGGFVGRCVCVEKPENVARGVVCGVRRGLWCGAGRGLWSEAGRGL